MINRVIYIGYFPLEAKFERDYYLKELQANGIAVEYWDCSILYHNKAKVATAIDRDYIVHVETRQALHDLVHRCDNNALVIPQIDLDARTIPLFKMLSKSTRLLGFFARPGLPGTTFKQKHDSFLWRLLRLLKHPANLWVKVHQRVQRKMLRPFDVIFAAGRMAMETARARQVVPVNHFDYDNYLLERSQSKPPPNPYAVFLDDGFIGSPDFDAYNFPKLFPAAYFASMNAFFKVIESAGYEVVIAAHPRVSYPAGVWGDRRVIAGQARDLVRGCSLVLIHASTSVSFAVLYSKPILSMYTGEIQYLYPDSVFPRIRKLAETLGREMINVDHPHLPAYDVFNIDATKYKAYIYQYLTSPESEHTPTSEIFLKWLKGTLEVHLF